MRRFVKVGGLITETKEISYPVITFDLNRVCVVAVNKKSNGIFEVMFYLDFHEKPIKVDMTKEKIIEFEKKFDFKIFTDVWPLPDSNQSG